MTSEVRESGVLDAVVSLVDRLLDDFDVVELLTELTQRCSVLLDVSSAGLLLADPNGMLHLMAATSERTEDVELFQLQAEEGPCLDCFATGAAVSVADLAGDARWPRFAPVASEAGFASVHALPMRAAGRTLGALGLFGTSVGELNDADLLVGRSLAHIASVAIVQGHPPTGDSVVLHLRDALTSRVVVEQAKGLLRQRLDVTVEEAFDLLRAYSRESGGHLSDVARRLMSEPDSRDEIVDAIRELRR